nr:RNA-directed DNA polymerase, eukaryota [Tanacetum cinerariifolium]
MHNDIMATGFKERPPMLAPGSYAQWKSCFTRKIDKKYNKDLLRKCIEEGPYVLTQLITLAVPANGDNPSQPRIVREETYANTFPDNKVVIDVEADAIHMILNGIGNDIYSTVDACPNSKKMWLVIEHL